MEKDYSLLKRLYIYQKERFPFFGNILLIGAFTFSALSYSRVSRGAAGFVTLRDYLIGVATTVTLFFLVRIFDEHKDQEDDAKYRAELPVPRGLISLKELRNIAIITIGLQLLLNSIFAPKMLPLYFLAFGYLCLMGKEFFVSKWLKNHQLAYVCSHMLIIPLIDMYASGLDWLQAGVPPPKGLLFFFAVSFMNGIVLEFGRKIRTKEQEKVGVVTYSSLYGADKAAIYWLLVLSFTYLLSLVTAWYAGQDALEWIILTIFFAICAMPAILFMINKTPKRAKFIEYSSALWTLAMYITLGGLPMLLNLFF